MLLVRLSVNSRLLVVTFGSRKHVKNHMESLTTWRISVPDYYFVPASTLVTVHIFNNYAHKGSIQSEEAEVKKKEGFPSVHCMLIAVPKLEPRSLG